VSGKRGRDKRNIFQTSCIEPLIREEKVFKGFKLWKKIKGFHHRKKRKKGKSFVGLREISDSVSGGGKTNETLDSLRSG